MICPNCANGNIYGMAVKVSCPICKGTNVLPDGTEYLPETGKRLKEARLSEGLTLRFFCEKYGIDVIERSQREKGFFRKEG